MSSKRRISEGYRRFVKKNYGKDCKIWKLFRDGKSDDEIEKIERDLLDILVQTSSVPDGYTGLTSREIYDMEKNKMTVKKEVARIRRKEKRKNRLNKFHFIYICLDYYYFLLTALLFLPPLLLHPKDTSFPALVLKAT